MPRTRPSRPALWLLLAVLAPLAGGLTSYLVLSWLASGGWDRLFGGAEAQPPPGAGGRMTVEEARAFREYPVFWAGPDFDGMPITFISRKKTPPWVESPVRTDRIDIIYGDCTPSGTPATCVRPLQITSTPYCLLPPERDAPEVLAGPPFEVRGATAQWVAAPVAPGVGAATLVLRGGGSTVIIIATGGSPVAMEAGTRLHSLNGLGPRSALDALGPVTGVCD